MFALIAKSEYRFTSWSYREWGARALVARVARLWGGRWGSDWKDKFLHISMLNNLYHDDLSRRHICFLDVELCRLDKMHSQHLSQSR
jgi:hypothetical protein